MTARPAPRLRLCSSRTSLSPRGCHTLPPFPPSPHRHTCPPFWSLATVCPSPGPAGGGACSRPLCLPSPTPDPNRSGLGEGGRGVRSALPSLAHTCAQLGSPHSPLLTPGSCLPIPQAGHREGLAWGAPEAPPPQAPGPPGGGIPQPPFLGTHRGPGVLRTPRRRHHHLPVLPRFQKRLPVSLVCPCTRRLG